jgi:hypothetical protein
MSRWWGRAQVEPLAALVAVFAVGVALTTYAGVLDATLPTPDRNLAEPTVERTEREIAEHGIVDPENLSEGPSAGPDGYRVNLTLATADQKWHAGPTPPANVDVAEISVSVQIAPGRIRPGRLRATVWR